MAPDSAVRVAICKPLIKRRQRHASVTVPAGNDKSRTGAYTSHSTVYRIHCCALFNCCTTKLRLFYDFLHHHWIINIPLVLLLFFTNPLTTSFFTNRSLLFLNLPSTPGAIHTSLIHCLQPINQLTPQPPVSVL